MMVKPEANMVRRSGARGWVNAAVGTRRWGQRRDRLMWRRSAQACRARRR
jgi:hypothetical protein